MIKLIHLGLSEKNIQYFRYRKLSNIKDLFSYQNLEKDIKNAEKNEKSYDDTIEFVLTMKNDLYPHLEEKYPMVVEDIKNTIYFIFENKKLYLSEIQKKIGNIYGIYIPKITEEIFSQMLKEGDLSEILPDEEELFALKKEKETLEKEKNEIVLDADFDFDAYHERQNKESDIGKPRYLASSKSFFKYSSYINSKAEIIFQNRMEGKKREQIIKENPEISLPEYKRVMAIISHSIPKTREEYFYYEFLSKYKVNKDDFYLLFPKEKNNKTFEFLKFLFSCKKQAFGKNPLDKFLNDKDLIKSMMLDTRTINKIEKIISEQLQFSPSYITLSSGYAIKTDINSVFEYVAFVIEKTKKICTITQFIQMMDVILKEIFSKNPKLQYSGKGNIKGYIIPLSEKQVLWKIKKHKNLLLGKKNIIYSYPIEKVFDSNKKIEEFLNALKFNENKNVLISTQYFLENKKEFLERLQMNMLDSNALYNLFKKIISKNKKYFFEKYQISLNRCPHIQFGSFDFEKQITNAKISLDKKNIPQNQKNILTEIKNLYGLEENSVRTNFHKYLT